MPLPVTCVGRGQACRRCIPLASNNGALAPGSSRDTWQILEVPGQPVAVLVSDESKSPSLASGAHCNLGHMCVYLAGKQHWGNMNKISLVCLASHGQLLTLEKWGEAPSISPNAFSCLYRSVIKKRA